jgi:hypothetical protein
VIISPSLPFTGTIPNNGTWASPTILDSTKGQYTTIPRPKGFPIEGKKHMKELKNKFDMGFNEINHKIHMKVKRLSSHHPVTRPNAFVVLTTCKSEPSTRLHYS